VTGREPMDPSAAAQDLPPVVADPPAHERLAAWDAEADLRWPDALDATDPHILGRGRWATVSWCGPMAVYLHDSQDQAERALRMIGGGCGHRCWGDHELVDLDEPEAVDPEREHVRGPQRAAHFRACGQCRDWAGGRAPDAAMRRALDRMRRAAP
jgi:hypothetical protein